MQQAYSSSITMFRTRVIFDAQLPTRQQQTREPLRPRSAGTPALPSKESCSQPLARSSLSQNDLCRKKFTAVANWSPMNNNSANEKADCHGRGRCVHLSAAKVTATADSCFIFLYTATLPDVKPKLDHSAMPRYLTKHRTPGHTTDRWKHARVAMQ